MLWFELSFTNIKWSYLFSTICFCILFIIFLRKKQIPLLIKRPEKKAGSTGIPCQNLVFKFDRADKQNLSQRTMSFWGHSIMGSSCSIKEALGTWLICLIAWKPTQNKTFLNFESFTLCTVLSIPSKCLLSLYGKGKSEMYQVCYW